MVSDLSRGGVPVFSLEIGNFSLEKKRDDDYFFYDVYGLPAERDVM